MHALLRVELLRQRPMLVRMLAVTVLVCAIFYVAGKRTPADFLAMLIGSSLGVALIVPMGVSRDKLEGTLEFLCGLPVEPREIAASRFIAVAVLAIPWALGTGAFSFALPAPVPLNPMGVAALMWLVLLVLGVSATALLARFELETMLGAPVVAIVIFVVLVPRAVRMMAPGLTREATIVFLQQPSTPFVITIVVLGTAAITGAVAFRVTSRAFENYRKDATRR